MLLPITYLRPALDIPYCHHEKWDGSGYPRGLKGEEIPLTARIFAVVDVWDALTSDRPYRTAWTPEKTLALIRAGSGNHFDPQVVAAFEELLKRKGRLNGKHSADDRFFSPRRRFDCGTEDHCPPLSSEGGGSRCRLFTTEL